MLAVGRKRDGTIHVANQQARRSAEHRRLIQNRNGVFFLITPNEVEIASVGRKSETEIACRSGRDNLRVAASLDMAKAECLEAMLFPDDGEIFSVGRNRGEHGVTVVRKIFDGKMLEGK